MKMPKPSVEDLQEYLQDLVHWERLAIHLPGIEQKDIDIIKRDRNDTVDQKQCLYDVWLRAYPDASWEDVVHALEKVKENGIAKNIREKFNVNETAMSPKQTEEAPRDLLHAGTGAVTSKVPVAKHVVDELEKLDNDFNTLTIDVRSNIQSEVDSKAKSLEYFVQHTKDLKAFEINFPPLVQTTDQFFDAIRPHYNFLDCYIVIRLALQLTSTVVHRKANAYNRRVNRFLNTKKVQDLHQKLEPYFKDFRPGDKVPVTVTLQKAWGRQNLYLVKQLVQTLFADDLQHSDRLQWFSVTTKCFIVGFLAPVQLEINLIKCSRMKLKFMKLTGIIGLEINNEQILIEDEDDMFPAEKSLKEAKRNSDIEAVQILQTFLYENPEKQEAYLPQFCGCGKCAIIGWRTEISSQNTAFSQFSSLLIADHEHSSNLFFGDDNARHTSLCIATSDLIRQFQLVVSDIWNHLGTSIQENDLDIFSIADALSNVFDIQLPIFPDLDSIQNYFHSLRVSWYNFRTLRLLVSHVMTKSNQNLLADWDSYLAQFEQFSSIHTLDNFSSVSFRVEEQNIFILEVNEFTSKYKLLDIDRICNSLSTILGFSPVYLNLLAVRAEMLLAYIHYCYSDYLTVFKSITPEQLKKISRNMEYRILSITDLHSQFRYENIQNVKDQPIKSTEASETAQHDGISSGTHFEVEGEKELKHESHQEVWRKQSVMKDREIEKCREEISELKVQLRDRTEKENELRKKVETNEEEILKLKAQLKGKTEEEELKKQIKTNEAQCSSLRREVLDLKQNMGRRISALPFYFNDIQYPPSIITVMTNYSDKLKQKYLWFSPSFYSSPQGYKMCLKVCASGQEGGEGTHVSVYVHLMSGEYDDFLSWPFRGKIHFQLLNRQADDNHISGVATFDESTDEAACGRVFNGLLIDSCRYCKYG